jgi:phospholipid-binding lipoprotein MlaA
MKFLLPLVSCLLAGGCATLPPNSKPDPRDPWERFNRTSFKINDKLDRAVLRPTARAYVKVTPGVVRTGIRNVIGNLNTVTTIVNGALQGKMRQAGRDSTRFLLNTTLGLGGLFDPATAAGFENNDEDFGQTLGVWGVQSGPYLMLPMLGPSTVRDTVGRLPEQFTYPVNYLEDDSTRYIIRGVEVVNLRAGLLELDAQLEQSFDRYAFVRNAWLQRREYKVRDGNIEDTFEEEEFSEEPPDQPAAEPAAESPPPATP